jgi:hypothetical protein
MDIQDNNFDLEMNLYADPRNKNEGTLGNLVTAQPFTSLLLERHPKETNNNNDETYQPRTENLPSTAEKK